MKIYDISQEVFSCAVYPGDPAPKREVLKSMDCGDAYNLTAFSMCAHNGTHIDAPKHFINGGKAVDEMHLEQTVGLAYVTHFNGTLAAADALDILKKAKEASAEAQKRLLIGGDAVISLEAARVFASADILLIGNNSQTVGPPDAPMEVHKVLLGKGIALLEGLRLDGVEDGVYMLFAAPINLAGADGAPCRAILVKT